MAGQFSSYIAVDWSGGGRAHETSPGLAVAEAGTSTASLVRWHQRRRSRVELVEWLAFRLRPNVSPVCVGLDFAFGYPKGAMQSVFGASSWRELADRLLHLSRSCGTARDIAAEINAQPKFKGNGPFRTNSDRTNARFYLDHGISYYRLVETFVPQAISQWYLGSGATVAFSTLTGLAVLGELLARRDRGDLAFSVHPFEAPQEGLHALVEIYSAIWPKIADQAVNEHERDALRAAVGLGNLGGQAFSIPIPSGLNVNDAECRITEEGWIAGVV